jgi:hypothetical protein
LARRSIHEDLDSSFLKLDRLNACARQPSASDDIVNLLTVIEIL